ncbi:MAG: hypothetical protein SP1CHLAM54_02360 [Chlamydiia bacterium]|nr:hypothetical protein [Chlamydiia bacterium]MCH9615153.1 hypothetical protein [Chlamydiia bacterium]MCH9628525.1 hypothetical protein [Chlamydiia bacterium]
MNSKILLCLLTCIQCFGLTKEHFETFYNVYFDDVKHNVHSTTPAPSAKSQFADIGFNLWVYQSGTSASSGKTYPDEYKNLVTFVKNYNITKVIYYVPYNADTDYFDPAAAAGTTSLVQDLQTNPLPSTCKLEFQFDKGGFSYSSPNSHTSPTQTAILSVSNRFEGNNYIGSGSTAAYFLDLEQKLNWVLDMQSALASSQPFTITGITIDPEGSGLPPTAGTVETAYHIILNYIDSYLIANNQLGSLTNNITYGVNSTTPTFADRSQVPLAASSQIGGVVTSGKIYSFPLTNQPPWRTNQTSPFIDNVYIQAYQPDIPYIFTNSLNGSNNAGDIAAKRMLQLLSKVPYLIGPGTATFTSGGDTVTGQGVDFTQALNVGGVNGYTKTGVPQYSHLAYLPPGEAQACLNPFTANEPDDPRCANDVETIAATTLTLNSPITAPTPAAPVQWLTVEILANWRNFTVTQDMVDGITFFFSAESAQPDTFFGSWTLNQFVNFAQQFKSQGKTYGVFQSATGGDSPLPIGPNIGVYSYDIINGSYSVKPENIWFPGE